MKPSERKHKAKVRKVLQARRDERERDRYRAIKQERKR